MSAEVKHTSMDPFEQADAEAVYRHAFEGKALDPEVARRVHEWAARVTDEIYRSHGLIDAETFQELLIDDDEELVAADERRLNSLGQQFPFAVPLTSL